MRPHQTRSTRKVITGRKIGVHQADRAAYRRQMDDWIRWLTEPFRDRPVILGFRLLASTTDTVGQLAAWGARKPLVIATGDGTGPLPDPESVHVVRLPEVVSATMTSDIRHTLALAADPPSQVVAALDRYDPEREALFWATAFQPNGRCAGRDVFGGRSPEWVALEDKTRCDQLWDEAGIARAPSAVVEVSEAPAAAGRLDEGEGTVWSGDAQDGMNGGGDFVRRISTAADAETALAFFSEACDTVRVMPFLPGTACSIHGFVLPDGVAAFRPVEMLGLPDGDRFHFAGASSWWDPAPDVREQMRAAARAVGRVLDRDHGYRGSFSIDGVAGPEGFLPTELNPRFSGGISVLAKSAPEIPVSLIQDNAVMGRDVKITASELEQRLTEAADATRFGQTMTMVAGPSPTASRDLPARWVDGSYLPVREGEGDAMITLGPSPLGTFVRTILQPPVISAGESARPHAAALRAFARSGVQD